MAFAAAEGPKQADPRTGTRLAAIANYYGPVDLTHWQVAPLVNFLWQREFHETLETSMLKFLAICASSLIFFAFSTLTLSA